MLHRPMGAGGRIGAALSARAGRSRSRCSRRLAITAPSGPTWQSTPTTNFAWESRCKRRRVTTNAPLLPRRRGPKVATSPAPTGRESAASFHPAMNSAIAARDSPSASSAASCDRTDRAADRAASAEPASSAAPSASNASAINSAPPRRPRIRLRCACTA